MTLLIRCSFFLHDTNVKLILFYHLAFFGSFFHAHWNTLWCMLPSATATRVIFYRFYISLHVVYHYAVFHYTVSAIKCKAHIKVAIAAAPYTANAITSTVSIFIFPPEKVLSFSIRLSFLIRLWHLPIR